MSYAQMLSPVISLDSSLESSSALREIYVYIICYIRIYKGIYIKRCILLFLHMLDKQHAHALVGLCRHGWQHLRSFRIAGSHCKIWGLGFKVQGLGFRF